VQATAAPGSDPAVTYGAGEHRRVDRAMAVCGDTAWTPDALRMFPVEAMCDGAGDETIVMCRAVQRLVWETLRTPSA
jgi:hypothetical protein